MNGTHSKPSTTITPVAMRPKFTSCFSLAVGPNLLVEVERHQRGRGVEHRSHAAHQRGQQRCDHQSDQSRGQQIDDQRRERDVAIGDFARRIEREQVADRARTRSARAAPAGTPAGFSGSPRKLCLPWRVLRPSRDSTRCTITWSVHQYQMPRIGAPKKMPVHGKSGSLAGLIMWK